MEIDIKTILQKAISHSELSHQFYLGMGHLVNKAESKEIFQYLAKNELTHKTFLEKWLAEEVCPYILPMADDHLAQLLETPAPTPGLSPKEALIMAIKRKDSSYKFYQNLASLQPQGEIRDFLEKMALLKLEDKEKLEEVYDNMAFPEVW
jgi:rubrerythrin